MHLPLSQELLYQKKNITTQQQIAIQALIRSTNSTLLLQLQYIYSKLTERWVVRLLKLPLTHWVLRERVILRQCWLTPPSLILIALCLLVLLRARIYSLLEEGSP